MIFSNMIAGGTHMTFGEKIQKLRKQQGLSQEALTEKVTVTRQTISKWELGQSTPDLEYIAQLSGIFGVSADYLIRDELVDPDALPLQKKKGLHLTERVKRHTLAALSAAALTAICVCLICDYFTSEYLSWSLVVAVSIRIYLTAQLHLCLPLCALEWTTYSTAGTVKRLKNYENNFTAWAWTERPRLEESN
jgi:transcriptional regulator with XRE-family HTH domain